MALAVREVSVAKGYDPRDFAMVASGGAGPLHAVAIARELHIPKVVVPRFPSHFSAVGMLLADERHDFIRTFYCDLATVDFATLASIIHEMFSQARANLRHAPPLSSDSAGNGAESGRQVHLDLRYVGQEFTLQVPVRIGQIENADRSGIRAAFDALYERRYAHHSPDEPVEMVNIRLAAVGKRPKLEFPSLSTLKQAGASHRREVYLTDARKPLACPIYQRAALGAECPIAGPALIQEHGTTTVLFEPDTCVVAPSGELIITVGAA
jgi:N-methylhydantoinase A